MKDSKGRRRVVAGLKSTGSQFGEGEDQRGVKLQLIGCSWAALIMANPLMIGCFSCLITVSKYVYDIFII